MIQILFVCLGNICRSPAAEGVMNSIIQKNKLSSKITCDSAGTASYHIGQKADLRMIKTAKKRNIDILSQARQLQNHDLKNFDYILSMDQQNYQDIQLLNPQNQYSSKIYHYKQFCPSSPEYGIPDPYYSNHIQAFEQVLDLLQEGCQNLLNYIIQHHQLNINH